MVLKEGRTFFTTKEVARIANVTARAVRHWVKDGLITDFYRSGKNGDIYVNGPDLLEFLYSDRLRLDRKAATRCITALRVGEVDRRLLFSYCVSEDPIAPESIQTRIEDTF